MLSASTNFKNYIQENGREIALRISWDAIVLQSEDIKSCVKWFDGALYTSVMQGIELEVEGVYDMKGKSLLVEFGVSYNGSAIEWLTWGTFLVKNHWNLAESKSTKIEAFDAMLKSHIAYDLTPTYPITVGNYLQAICTRLGITLATPTFTNSTVSIPDEKYAMLDNIIFRDVLDELAEVAGGIIHVRANGQLAVKYPTATSQSLNSNVKTVDVEKLFGEVNTLVLATTPAEDNTLREDLTSIATYGRHEVRFEDNQIMVLTPDSYIDNLFNQIKFTKYYPFELDSFGYGYFEVGDIINVVDENDVSYQTIVLGGSITIDGGFTEMMYAKVPDMATTPDYDNAHRTLSPRETAIILNRQARTIELRAAEIAAYADNQILLAVGTAIGGQDSILPYTQETFESGSINISGVNTADTSYLRTKGFHAILPSTDYILELSSLLNISNSLIFFYNSSNTFISLTDFNPNGKKFTTPATAAFFKVRLRKTSATTFPLTEMSSHYVRVVPVGKYLKGARYDFTDTNFAIKNALGETVLTADISGNLEMIGKVTATSGKIGRFDISGDDLVYTSDLFNREYDYSDIVKLSRILAGLDTATAYETEVYDTNNSGTLTITDLVQIRQYVDSGTPLPTPRRQIRSVIRIGTTSGELKTTAVSALGNTGSTFTMKADKLTGDLLNVKVVSAQEIIVGGESLIVNGTWTPEVVGSTSAGTGTYTSQIGRYTKIGRMVHFNLEIAWTAHTGTGNIAVTLPFRNGSTFSPCSLLPSNLTYSNQLTALVVAGASLVRLYTHSSNAGFGTVTMDTTGTLYMSGTYMV